MINVKKSFRKTEIFLLIAGLILSIIFSFRSNLTFGYFIGFITFSISYELFFILESKTKTRKLGYILLTNFKLVIIGGLFYYIRLTGVSPINMIIGFIVCYTLAVFSLLITAYYSVNLLKSSKKRQTL